jgi:8-oxo-dGTP pyrophosphatase MutT (NUDIX family)
MTPAKSPQAGKENPSARLLRCEQEGAVAKQSREFSLEELLTDPIVWSVMKSDQVEEQDLRALLGRVAKHLSPAVADAAGTDGRPDHGGQYRKGVGIMLLNANNEVLVAQRWDTQNDAWQMPQGGIEGNETPSDAAFRELREEIGTDRARIIAESRGRLRYDLPPHLRQRWAARGPWRGQEQKWFVMRFEGTDSDINLATAHPEFSAWQWVPIERLPELVVAFKKPLYVDILEEFGHALVAEKREVSGGTKP